MVARREVGVFQDQRGCFHRIGVPGEADIQGITPTGRGIAVEVKVGRDTVRRRQSRWRDSWLRNGGLHAVIRPDRNGWQQAIAALVGEPENDEPQ